MTEAEIRDAVAAYARDWAAFDAEALMAHFALPQILVGGGKTSFLETEEEVRETIDRLLAVYREHGVAAAEPLEVHVEPLPDAAARALVKWRLSDAAGHSLIEFKTIYTMIADDDGVPAIVAIDADSEVAAWAAAGWRTSVPD